METTLDYATKCHHCQGKNATPGHEYLGGQYCVQNASGGWVTFRYGDPARNCPDSHHQALTKAKEYLKLHWDECRTLNA